MKKQVLLAVGVVALAGIAYAAAQDLQAGPRERRRPQGNRDAASLKQDLGLSDQQVSQLQESRREARKAAIRRHADAQLARLALQEALQAQSVDQKAVEARIKELSDLHAAGLRAHVDGQLAMRQILTPDQREKLQQRRVERPRPREQGQRPRRPGPRRGEGDDGENEPLTRPDVR